jgi:hypothetical protein
MGFLLTKGRRIVENLPSEITCRRRTRRKKGVAGIEGKRREPDLEGVQILEAGEGLYKNTVKEKELEL